MPNQVRLRCVQLTSYRFLQTLPLPATPLRFGLSSPWSGRHLFLSTDRGGQARWANERQVPRLLDTCLYEKDFKKTLLFIQLLYTALNCTFLSAIYQAVFLPLIGEL